VENVTHTLAGVALAHAFFRDRAGRAAVPILAAASNLPDIDVLVHLSGDPAAVTLRRSFGHSLLLLPIACLLLTLLLRRLVPRLPLPLLLGMVAAGAAGHLLLDLINSFGVLLLWPASLWRPELAMVFIVDPVLTFLLAAPLLACWPRPLRPRLGGLSRAALAAAVVYLGVCGAGRLLAARELDRATTHDGLRPDFTYVFPEPLGPHRWRGVARQEGVYSLYLLYPFGGGGRDGAVPAGRLASAAGAPAARAAAATPLGRRLRRFFKAPVWEVARDGGKETACVHDLRFRSIVLDRGAVFVFCFPDGG
jgi:inner membrane protein